jgi:hypothetical protein
MVKIVLITVDFHIRVLRGTEGRGFYFLILSTAWRHAIGGGFIVLPELRAGAIHIMSGYHDVLKKTIHTNNDELP